MSQKQRDLVRSFLAIACLIYAMLLSYLLITRDVAKFETALLLAAWFITGLKILSEE